MLFCKKLTSYFFIIQIYVDDIILCVSNEPLCEDFSKLIDGGPYSHLNNKIKRSQS